MTCVSSPLSLRWSEIPAGAARGLDDRLGGRVTGALDRGVCGKQPREGGLRLGAQRPVRGQQRLGAVGVGGQEKHGEPGPLREPECGRGQLVRPVQDNRCHRCVTRAA